MLLLLVGLRLISPWPAVFARGAEAPGPPRCWVAGSPRCWLAGGELPGPHAAAAGWSAPYAAGWPAGNLRPSTLLLVGRASTLLGGVGGSLW